MEFKNILLERKNHITILKFNRREVLNALDTNILNELSVADEIKNDDEAFEA